MCPRISHSNLYRRPTSKNIGALKKMLPIKEDD